MLSAEANRPRAAFRACLALFALAADELAIRDADAQCSKMASANDLEGSFRTAATTPS